MEDFGRRVWHKRDKHTTHVDDDDKVRCEWVNLATTNEFSEVEFVNENMHSRITHHRGNENYVDVKFDEELLIGDEWLHMMQ